MRRGDDVRRDVHVRVERRRARARARARWGTGGRPARQALNAVTTRPCGRASAPLGPVRHLELEDLETGRTSPRRLADGRELGELLAAVSGERRRSAPPLASPPALTRDASRRSRALRQAELDTSSYSSIVDAAHLRGWLESPPVVDARAGHDDCPSRM